MGRGGGQLAPGSPALGGSQAGVRVYLPLAGPVALTGRVSTALGTRAGREASLGLALRRGNAGFLLEQRLPLAQGGRRALAATAYAGAYDVALPLGLRAEGYAQAGAVGLRRRELFAEGYAGAARDLATLGPARVSVGAGIWGSAQRNATRLDAGPQLVARLPLGPRTLRASLDYRVRATGNATPGSGAALSLGLDF